MKLNYHNHNQQDEGNSGKDSVCIKYGSVYYRIQVDQIAYLYKTEGIFFLVDKNKLKLPLFMNSISEFPLNLSGNTFFRLSEGIIVANGSVTIASGLDRSIAIASNNLYRNKFAIPKVIENDFRFWLLKP